MTDYVDEFQWVTAAKAALRRVVTEGKYCIFSSGAFFVQFGAYTDVFGRSNKVMIIFEAVSGFYQEEARQLFNLNPHKIDALHQFGFSDNPSGNYFQYVDIKSEYDVDRCVRLALQVLRDIYGIEDVASIGIICQP